jgi:chromosomal replication initiation ATPase DnaA
MSETGFSIETNCLRSQKDLDSVRPPPFLRQQFLESVAAAGKVSLPELTSRSNNRRASRVRWAGMLYLRDSFGWSLPRIARVFDRDHTTVMHGLKQARVLVESNARFRSMVKRVARDN